MRLNPDCIRDILIALESITTEINVTYTFHSWEEVPEQIPSLQKYPVEMLSYHIHQLALNGMLYEADFPRDGFSFKDLTPSAHEFLANIRQETNWKETKEIASKAGSFGLDVLKSIAANIASAYVKYQLNLP